jgi:hypothetical protein
MSNLIENIAKKDFAECQKIFESKMAEITKTKLHEMKKIVSARLSESSAKNQKRSTR